VRVSWGSFLELLPTFEAFSTEHHLVLNFRATAGLRLLDRLPLDSNGNHRKELGWTVSAASTYSLLFVQGRHSSSCLLYLPAPCRNCQRFGVVCRVLQSSSQEDHTRRNSWTICVIWLHLVRSDPVDCQASFIDTCWWNLLPQLTTRQANRIFWSKLASRTSYLEFLCDSGLRKVVVQAWTRSQLLQSQSNQQRMNGSTDTWPLVPYTLAFPKYPNYFLVEEFSRCPCQ